MSTTLKKTIKIENREIGEGHPVFIIAEIGINHNGDIELAKKMIDSAKACGVDCVKFQTFRAEEFMGDKTLIYEYTNQGKQVSENMFDMFKRVELPVERYCELFDYARSLNLIPLTSVADPLSVEVMNPTKIGAYKLSSEDLINLPLVEYVIQKRLPIIFSTGMANEEEINDVIDLLNKHQMTDVSFLHCVSLYPTIDEEVHLGKMKALQNKYPSTVIGYSDHSLGIEAALGTVALGAKIIEKHFTLDKNLPGPDQALSSDPAEMKALVTSIRRMEKMLGKVDFVVSEREQKEAAQLFRRSVVSSKNLSKGHVLCREDLCLKRPGKGLKAKEMSRLIGKKLKTDIVEDTPINFSMVDIT